MFLKNNFSALNFDKKIAFLFNFIIECFCNRFLSHYKCSSSLLQFANSVCSYLGMRKIISYQPDGFFFLLAALKFFNVTTAMLKNFALLKEKITSSFLVDYLLPHPLKNKAAIFSPFTILLLFCLISFSSCLGDKDKNIPDVSGVQVAVKVNRFDLSLIHISEPTRPY